MERQFCINWPAIVEEAKQRRKTQQLTQLRLAKMAGVSTPTISHFESGKKDIQLSTVIRILTVLGMNDQRNLTFAATKARHDFSRESVIFMGQDADKKVQCAITDEALQDHFSGNEKDSMKIFLAHQQRIEHEARRKYLAGNLEADGTVLLKTSDIG